MIVVLDSNEPPRVIDLDRLDRLQLGRARTIAAAATSDPAFGDRFDAMIGDAASQGWLNAAGTHVRAHDEPAV